MAHQQVYQQYSQNKGTLTPGQTISVNNYTVQVERYLSQGGFAHVYLVRTPVPVYNTTHHVLKRIGVANESMLTEVKKEVDIMRLLKGHPNIVHLIDAAWHKLPSGTFEVFILMEFCPGGGIIDMMNRRLRERLTEAEILQIFVDVCEGVAYMHNSRPPLLHRDLKVENILQSSATSYKLCDFGSATTVSNPPTTMQEIRALEADLNRHTTLQYRAPEMVDVYSKRPVNEKSDVWALGVLLYKLCYYTTPFEEHGPLAILNVQYRIPSYPGYSQEMNILIASMLREHGSQRPTVFELLNHVHRLRGTKSMFNYNIPVPLPLVPRPPVHAPPRPSPSPHPLDGTISYVTPPTKSAISLYDPKVPPGVNAGIQARDKVLEAIEPMRRGRPTTSQNFASRNSSPKKSIQPRQDDTSKSFDWPDVDQDRAWKIASERQQESSRDGDDAWMSFDVSGKKPVKVGKREKPGGFGDDFSEKLWGSADPNSVGTNPTLPPRPSPKPNIMTVVRTNSDIPVTPLAYTGTTMIRPKADRLQQHRDRDAFEGLGLMTSSSKPAPTMGEAIGARKLRTGLASMSISPTNDYGSRDAGKPISIPRPTPSPQSNYLSPTNVQPKSVSPIPTPNSSHNTFYRPPSHSPAGAGASPSSVINGDGVAIESRFPSLEELDAQFSPPVNPLYPSAVNDASTTPRYAPPATTGQTKAQALYASGRVSHMGTGGATSLLKPISSSSIGSSVDGVRSEQVTGIAMREPKESRHAGKNPSFTDRNEILSSSKESLVPPVTSRKPIFSSSEKIEEKENAHPVSNPSNDSLKIPSLPKRPVANTPPRDWLTGEDVDDVKSATSAEVPILRESPSKRASLIETSDFTIPPSSVAQHVFTHESAEEPQSYELSPTVSKFVRAFPSIEKIDTQKSQQAFSNGLTDNWSPVATRHEPDREPDSSSGDEEGPEEPNNATKPPTLRKKPTRPKGRQSSVHELVSQYDGTGAFSSISKEKEREQTMPGLTGSIGDYKDYKPMKPSKPAGLTPPSNTLDVDKRTPSPTSPTTRPLASAPSRSPRLDSKSPLEKEKDKPLPPLNGVTSSGRSRPQSMFIFPPKSTDGQVLTSPNLQPPEEPRPRARRTSISDMVQRYEAIGSAGKLSPGIIPFGPPSPINKPAAITKPSNSAGSGTHTHTSFPSQSKPIPVKKSLSGAITSRPIGEPLKSQSTSTGMAPQSTGRSQTPSKIHRKLTLDKEKLTPSAPSTPDRNNISRSRRISAKAEPPINSIHVRSDVITNARATKTPAPSSSVNPPDSPRKPPIFLTDDRDREPASRSDDRPASPERPYQGVGKLIDQWQKKAEASQGPAVVKRADIKRTGVVRGGER